MADGARIYPVNLVVMHHAVSDEMVNWNDRRVRRWFSDVGRNRGYAGVAHSRHFVEGYETFTQAHFCLHSYTADSNKYGWRLTQLLDDPFNNVCWHAGSWPVNQRSIGIETAGNYLNKLLPDKALMCIADTFRAHDKKIGGILNITYHRMYSATACPGKIAEQVKKVIDMINNPAKWNAKLWPAPAPKPTPKPTTPPPVVQPKPEPPWYQKLESIPPKTKVLEKDINLFNFVSGAVVKLFKKGEKVTVNYKTGDYYMTAFSAQKKIPNGFIVSDFDFVELLPAITTTTNGTETVVVPIVVKDAPQTISGASEPKKSGQLFLDWLISSLIKFLKNLWVKK